MSCDSNVMSPDVPCELVFNHNNWLQSARSWVDVHLKYVSQAPSGNEMSKSHTAAIFQQYAAMQVQSAETKNRKNGCGSKVCDMFPHFFWLRLYLEHEKEPSPIGNSSVEFTMLVQIFLAGLANKHTLWDKKQNLVCWLEAAQILAKRRYLCDPLPCHSAQIHAHLQRD